MDIPDLPLLPTSSASEAAGHAKLSAPARALLGPETTLTGYLEVLLRDGLFKDVYSLLAVCLPAREAVWWAALCIRQSHGPVHSAKDEAALRSAVEWVLDPTTATRKTALDAGQQAGTNSACGCLAQAAGQTHAPLALLPEPADGATPTAPVSTVGVFIRRAILLASVHGDPRVLAPYPEHFVNLGLKVASGEYTWKRLVSRAASAAPRPQSP